MGPTQPHSDQVHAEKYRSEGEGFREAMNRIASGLSDNPSHYKVFRDILMDMRFMPAGRIQAAIGSPKNITPYNCFVSAKIHDSFVHGDENGQNSIMDVGKQAAATMRMGGGIGYGFSSLRPSRDFIRGVQSTTDGPLAFMHIYDAVCKATSSAGNRRGAQMGVLRVDHPDILKFIRAKQPDETMQALWEVVEDLSEDDPRRMRAVMALQETLKLTGFNLSIGITDEFLECLASGRPFPLRFEGRVYSHMDPEDLWETIMRSTWDWAEPGVLQIDTINKMNNLWYCETIEATNPCGEQPLPAHGACLLGSFNLVKYIGKNPEGQFTFDWHQFDEDIAPVVRAMDNVVDYASYPLPEQEREAKNKRRMGIGVTGLANAAEALGHLYGSPAFLEFEKEVLWRLSQGSYMASVELAREKGAFPLFDSERYIRSKHLAETLEPFIIEDIRRFGIRNSHLTSIAPTGTISYTADNVSSGIEPVFEYEGQRYMNMKSGKQLVEIKDYGVREFGVHGKLSRDVTAEEHVAVLTTAAKLVDSAVSKTCNVSPDMPWEDFKGLYLKAFEGGAKGCTTFNPGGKRLGIFVAKPKTERLPAEVPATNVVQLVIPTASDEEDTELDRACQIDYATGRRSCE